MCIPNLNRHQVAERRKPLAYWSRVCRPVAKTYHHLDYIKDRRVSTEVDGIGQAGRMAQHRIFWGR